MKEFLALKHHAKAQLLQHQRKIELGQGLSIDTKKSMERTLVLLTKTNAFFQKCTSAQYDKIMKSRPTAALHDHRSVLRDHRSAEVRSTVTPPTQVL